MCLFSRFSCSRIRIALKLMCLFFPSIFYNSNTGFLCLVIYRRDTHVVELQIGNLTSRLEDACAPDQYDVSRTPFTTLLGRMKKHFSHSDVTFLTPQCRGAQNKKSAALFAGGLVRLKNR